MLARVISVILLLPLFFWVQLAAEWLWFATFWCITLTLAANEWARLANFKRRAKIIFTTATATTVAAIFISFAYRQQLLLALALVLVLLASVFWLFIMPIILRYFTVHNAIDSTDGIFAALGMLLLTAFAAALCLLMAMIERPLLLALFVLVWLSDIGAFFCGRRWGKTPFAATISPNKTWQGFWGGMICALLAAMALPLMFTMAVNTGFFLFISLIITVYAALGDLFESVLKRRNNFKDSGNLIPGHGGVLDRIDSWLPALVLWATFFALCS